MTCSGLGGQGEWPLAGQDMPAVTFPIWWNNCRQLTALRDPPWGKHREHASKVLVAAIEAGSEEQVAPGETLQVVQTQRPVRTGPTPRPDDRLPAKGTTTGKAARRNSAGLPYFNSLNF